MEQRTTFLKVCFTPKGNGRLSYVFLCRSIFLLPVPGKGFFTEKNDASA